MNEPIEFEEIVKLRHRINELNQDPVVEEILDQIEELLDQIKEKNREILSEMIESNDRCEYLEQREEYLEDRIEELKYELEEAERRFNQNEVIEWLCIKLEERDFSDSNRDSFSKLTKDQWREDAINAVWPH